jgi:hypothetical protein
MKLVLFLFCISIASCHSSNNERIDSQNRNTTRVTENKTPENQTLILQSGENYRIDISNHFYQVFYYHQDPIKISFSLTKEEEEIIFAQLEKIKTYQYSDTLYITSACNIFPQVFTTISFTKKQKPVMLGVDLNCKKFGKTEAELAREIRHLILTIQEIVLSKPDIKKIPKSDIGYM